MAEANLKIVVSKEDTALKELAALWSSVFGGATIEKAKATAKAVGDAVVNEAKELGKKRSQSAEETAQKIAEAEVAAAAKAKAAAEESERAIAAATKNAADIKVAAERDYVALKHEYVQKGLNETRQAIHEEEQAIKQSRDAITRATEAGANKETVAVLKAERDKQNARLQGLRSVEKEITGARTFTEQLEKNVYEPINKKEASGGALATLLFGKVGALEKDLKKSEAQVAEHEHKIAANAEQSRSAMAAQEAQHAQKVKQISEQITSAKTAELRKELEEQKKSIEQQIAEEKKLTQAKQSEETLQLQHHQATLEKELSETKKQHAKEKEQSSKEGGGKGAGLVGGVLGGAGVMAGIELFKQGTEAAKEYATANAGLKAATGKDFEEAKKQVEEIGDEFSISDIKVSETEAHVKAATGASGEELKKQTEAALAFTAATGKDADKMMQTATGRAKIMADAERNIAIAREKGNDPIMKSEHAQEKLQDTIGKLATTVIGSLSPAISAVTPILSSVGEMVDTVVKPAMATLQPVITLVSTSLVKLTPVIGELIQGALSILTPIIAALSDVLGALLPPIMSIVKTVSGFLAPLFKELGPLIGVVAGLIVNNLTSGLQIMLPVIAELLPPLLQLLNAILLPLIPIITQVAQIFSDVLAGAIKIVSTALLWLVDHAIKPAIEWLTVKIKPAIDDTVGYITKAVDAIKGVVSSITSFLGIASSSAKDGIDETTAAFDGAAQKMKATDAAATETQKANLASRLADVQAKESAGLITHEQALNQKKSLQEGFDSWQKKLTDNETSYLESEGKRRSTIVQGEADKQKSILAEKYKSGKLTAEEFNSQLADLEKKAGATSQTEAANQATVEKGDEKKRQRNALTDKLKLGKITAAEEQQMREQAQSEGDDMMLKKLDDFDKKKSSQAASAAKKGAKAMSDAARAAADQSFADRKEEIAAMDVTEREAKLLEKQAELQHSQDLLDVAEQYFGEKSKQYLSAQRQLQALQHGLKKEEHDDLIAQSKRDTEDQLTELSIRADREHLTDKQVSEETYQIKKAGLNDEILLYKEGTDEYVKLGQERAALIAKHDADELVAQRRIIEQTNQILLNATKEGIQTKIAARQAEGRSTEELEKQLDQIEIDAENNRYSKELADNKDALANAKSGDALRLSMKAQHEANMDKLDVDAFNKQRARDKEKITFLTGPLKNAFAQTGDAIQQKFFNPMIEKALGGKNIFSQFVSEVVGGLVKVGAGIIAQYAENAAAQAIFGATSVATATTTNAGILATAAPAAAAESVATFGGAAAAGGSGLLATMASVIPAMISFIPHAEGGIGIEPMAAGRHLFFERGPEAIIPLSSGRAQSQIQTAFGFEKALAPIHETLQHIKTHTANPHNILVTDNRFESARNNYKKREDRRGM